MFDVDVASSRILYKFNLLFKKTLKELEIIDKGMIYQCNLMNN